MAGYGESCCVGHESYMYRRLDPSRRITTSIVLIILYHIYTKFCKPFPSSLVLAFKLDRRNFSSPTIARVFMARVGGANAIAAPGPEVWSKYEWDREKLARYQFRIFGGARSDIDWKIDVWANAEGLESTPKYAISYLHLISPTRQLFGNVL